MDKTHNISLGGLAFHIDDAAYKTLNQYLRDIRLSLSKSEGIDEIISDVEYRMAELLRERMMVREVVNQSDVEYLIGVMGRPEDYYTDEFLDDDIGAERQKHKETYTYRQKKKLFRDPDDKMLGGVCAGLGHYIGIDTVWIRLALILLPFLDFLFLGISTGSVFLVYMILWIVVPEAKTTSDKLQMRGEPVNFDSIKDFFGNSPEIVRNNLNDFNEDARRVASSSGNVIGNLFRIMFKIILVFIIGFLIIIAFALLIGLVATLFGLSVAGLSVGMSGIAYGDQLSYLFEDGWEKIVAFISLGIVVLIPAVGLILLAMRLISSRYRVPKFIGFSLPMVWLLGWIGLIVVSIYTFTNFKYVDHEVKTVNIPTQASTIVMERVADSSFNSHDLDDLFNIKDGHLAIPLDDDITVKKSATGNTYIELDFVARGKTRERANAVISDGKFFYSVEDSLVKIDDYMFIEDGKKWRRHFVEPTLYLAEGMQVTFRNFDDINVKENGSSNWYSANSENIYKFEDNLFHCVNCPEDIVTAEEENEPASVEGVIKITNGTDSVIIKTNHNDTIHSSISNRTDSISD